MVADCEGEIFMVDRENENCEKNLLWGCSESMTVPPRCCARFYRNIFLNTECRYIYIEEQLAIIEDAFRRHGRKICCNHVADWGTVIHWGIG